MDLASVRGEIASSRLPAGWSVCTAEEGLALASQLTREVNAGHPLHDRPCVAVAKFERCERVLYYAEGLDGPLAAVQLSWQVPRGPDVFPWTERFASVDEWVLETTRR